MNRFCLKNPAHKTIAFLTLALLFTAAARALDVDMARLATAKKAQAMEFAGTQTNKVPPYVWSYFDAVRVDDWQTASKLAARIMNDSGHYSRTAGQVPPALQTLIWPPISETIGAYDQFHGWDNQWLHRFGSNLIASIPNGSIYFGGTDPGRFIVCALKESEFADRPLFVLTQNQLADKAYLAYLRRIYGGRIYIPTTNDFETAFNDYISDAKQRLKSGKIKPGANVQLAADGKVEASGPVAGMGGRG